jgi:hypothetical protein
MEARGCRWAAQRAWCGVVLAVGLAACSETGSSLRGAEDTPQIGLQRGGRWSVLTIRPPHLTGPQFNLLLKDHVLTGSISGGTAPGGNVHVAIADDGADGHGPLGPVSMDFVSSEDSTVAEGTWNGHRVHIVFRRESVKGTIADNSDSNVKGDPDRRIRSRTGNPIGQSLLEPAAANSSCEYFLTEISPDGALTGGSICSGMPQPTRLEVPKLANAYLTRPELVTVLVAVLSSPPIVVAEELGPRFDTNPPEPPPPPPVIIRRR